MKKGEKNRGGWLDGERRGVVEQLWTFMAKKWKREGEKRAFVRREGGMEGSVLAQDTGGGPQYSQFYKSKQKVINF